MLGIPLFADQLYNAAKVQYKGYGLQLPILALTPDDVVRAIKTILDDPYQADIHKASEIFRDKEHPLKRASYWVDHVLKFGGDHLHSHALDMPWYEYIMLDILGVSFAMEVSIALIFLMCCRFTLRRICRRGTNKLKIQ